MVLRLSSYRPEAVSLFSFDLSHRQDIFDQRTAAHGKFLSFLDHSLLTLELVMRKNLSWSAVDEMQSYYHLNQLSFPFWCSVWTSAGCPNHNLHVASSCHVIDSLDICVNEELNRFTEKTGQWVYTLKCSKAEKQDFIYQKLLNSAYAHRQSHHDL